MTYEYGYEFGVAPGKRPYANIEHYVLSRSLVVPGDAEIHVVRDRWLERVDELREREASDIYLCGGCAAERSSQAGSWTRAESTCRS